MTTIKRGNVPFTKQDVTKEMAIRPDSSTAITFFNNTEIGGVIFSVNWNAIKVGSTSSLAPGQNGQVGDEWVWYHTQATNAADGQFLADLNNVYGDSQVSLDMVSGKYRLSVVGP